MIFSNFWDSYFSSYSEFVEFSLRFTAAVSAVGGCGRLWVKGCGSAHYNKIGDAGVRRQRCERWLWVKECGSTHYTKIGDAGVRYRGLWTSEARR